VANSSLCLCVSVVRFERVAARRRNSVALL
jgi:hypothetical protein